MNQRVNALATDSAGNLYAGGLFTVAGGISVNGVAMWDGTQWSALTGPSGTGVAGNVFALATDTAGNLYAGGNFITAGGVLVNRVAMWDGTQWSALGPPATPGMSAAGTVLALTTDGTGNLFAGGLFTTTMGGLTVNRVARWDGTQWSAISGPTAVGMDNAVLALATDGAGNLYAGGTFTAAGGVTANRIAAYGFNITLPTVLNVDSIADTGDGSVIEGENTSAAINTLTVSFSEDVYDPAGDTDADDVTNPANYGLVQNGITAIPINSVTYSDNGSSGPFVATVNVNNGAALPLGDYAFTVVGSTSTISSAFGVPLAGDGVNSGTDFVRNFTIITGAPEALPDTGFAPGSQAALPPQPANKRYANLGDLWLEIPSLNVQASIVGVPLRNGDWDVSWLGSNAGWLEDTAYPSWAGNTVITGHVWDAFNNPGVFSNLRQLSYGDQIKIHINGLIYTYEVRRAYRVSANNMSVLGHEDYDIVTLVSCEGYDIAQDIYRYRRVIKAVLVAVE